MHHYLTAPRSKSLVLYSLLLSWTGCSTLTHYPNQMEHPIRDFEAGRLEQAYRAVQKKANAGLDRLVYTLESAMIEHTEGKPDQSNKEFSGAEQLIRAQEEKAVISASRTAEQGASLLLNEKTVPYTGEPFEKVLVNTFKALNYLVLRQYEDARVEVRRGFERQKENRERHEKELDGLERQAREQRINAQSFYGEVYSHYTDQSQIARRVANFYEDAFAYFLSALVYEMNGEYNDAYIDLKKVRSLRPGIQWVEDGLLTTASRSGLSDELREWEKVLGRKAEEPLKGEGQMVLFFECGMAPRKTQIMIPLFIPDVGVISLAFPKYEVLPNRIDHAALLNRDGSLIGRTSILTDLEAIAIRNLQDKMPILILKQIIRAAAKGVIERTAAKQAGLPGAIVSNIYSVVTEQADLRSWLTLPRNIQALRVALPPGRHDLVLSMEGSAGSAIEGRPFSIDVRPGQFVFVDARCALQNLIALDVF